MAFELVPHAPKPLQRQQSHLGADNILETIGSKNSTSPKRSPGGSPDSSQDNSDENQIKPPAQEAAIKEMPSLEHVLDNRMSEPTEADAYSLHKEDIAQFQYVGQNTVWF